MGTAQLAPGSVLTNEAPPLISPRVAGLLLLLLAGCHWRRTAYDVIGDASSQYRIPADID